MLATVCQTAILTAHNDDGAVTRSHFLHALPFKELKPAEIDLFIRRYEDPTRSSLITRHAISNDDHCCHTCMRLSQ
jgi:hypothetical protein